ncbi:hypothetical protein TrispH2_011737 [Trichoplax sp. H2]|nr:hypothetical protein TrispH2_011737 [Trichoplax sp. H2]|eukprot:RDD36373.1 hypothetical protein TrispH2_011737 [Trichoplax sp. H2]
MNSTSLYYLPLPNVLVSLVSMVLCLFMFLGIAGNITVIKLLKPKCYSISNESVYNLLLYYLAITDLITCCCYMPSLIITIVATSHFRQSVCILTQMLATSSASLNCGFLCMLSTERVVAVSQRQIIRKLLPRRRKKYYNIASLFISIVTVCFMFPNFLKYQFIPLNFSCFGIQANAGFESNSMRIINLITVPMVTWNAFLVFLAAILAISSYFVVRNKVSSRATAFTTGSNKSLHRSILRNGTMVIGTFFISYIPSLAIGIGLLGDENNRLYITVTRIIAATTASISAFANPLIYLFNHKKYRQQILQTLIRRYNDSFGTYNDDNANIKRMVARNTVSAITVLPNLTAPK